MWSGITLHPVVRDPATSNVFSILDAEGGTGYLGSKTSDTLAELDADYALIAKAPMLLNVLTELHRVCAAMDLANEADRPSEEEYQDAMASAAALIAPRAVQASAKGGAA